MASEWNEASNEDKRDFALTIFSEVIFDLDAHRITGFKLKPRVEPFLQAYVSC